MIERLIKQGAIDCSDIFNLSSGAKSMDIFMTRSPGVLVELIQIKKELMTKKIIDLSMILEEGMISYFLSRHPIVEIVQLGRHD